MDTDDVFMKRIPKNFRAICVISAGVVLQLTYGIVYTFGKIKCLISEMFILGNILPYLVSYLRWKVDPTQTIGPMIWLQSILGRNFLK